MRVEEAFSFLQSLAPFGMRFGLERTFRVLAALGNPERRFRVLHVAGTNGKGSTCAFAASLLAQSGARVGLYTSPHLVRLNERIRINDREIEDAALARGVDEVCAALRGIGKPDEPLTFFEFLTALALWHFAEQGVEVAVVETGLGGRLDATNAVSPEVAAISRIGLDHTALLGGTLAAIAGEKAGIFKPQAKVVLARQLPEALSVLQLCSQAVGQRPYVAGRDFALDPDGPFCFRSAARRVAGLEVSLAGPHQLENAEVAIQSVCLMVPTLSDEDIRQGLRRARWPGRMETVTQEPLTILDGAHNPDGARALAEAMRALHPQARVHLVLGVLADKDYRGIAEPLTSLAARTYLTRPRNERGLAAESLQATVRALGGEGEVFGSVREAVAAAQEAALAEGAGSLVLVAGSLYVVGEAREALLGR